MLHKAVGTLLQYNDLFKPLKVCSLSSGSTRPILLKYSALSWRFLPS